MKKSETELISFLLIFLEINDIIYVNKQEMIK